MKNSMYQTFAPALTIAAGLVVVGVAVPAQAAVSYLTQMRFVEAKVDAGGDMVDMERRVSMTFGGFDRTASASINLPGGTTGSAAVAQSSTFDDGGVTAGFSGSFATTGGDVTSTVKTVLETTFVLDGPTSYQFFPYGGSPELAASGVGTATLTGATSFGGPDLDVNLTVANGQALGDSVDEPLTGELAGGEYTFRYEFEGTASDGTLDFSFNPSLLFSDVQTSVPESPAVVPLPGAATAGLLTLGGLGAARLRKRRQA